MVHSSDKRQIRHFRRRRDHARRRAFAIGALPILKPQKVEGIHVELALLRQVQQHLSPDQHAPPRDGSLKLGATTVTRSSSLENLFFLGAGSAGSTSNIGSGTGAGGCVCASTNSAITPFKSSSARVLRAAEPFTRCRRQAPSASDPATRAQTLHLQRGLPHTLVFDHLQQYFPHALHLQGKLHYLGRFRGDAVRWGWQDGGVRLPDWVGFLFEHRDSLGYDVTWVSPAPCIRIVALETSPKRLHTSLVTVHSCYVSFRAFWGCCRKYSLIGFFKAKRRSIILNWLVHLLVGSCFARGNVVRGGRDGDRRGRGRRFLYFIFL